MALLDRQRTKKKEEVMNSVVAAPAEFSLLSINLQATKLFIVTSATKGVGYHPPS